MPLKSRIASLWRNVVHRDRVDRDLDDEVRTVYSMLVQEKMKRGLDHAEARRAATLELGRIESVEEHVRSVRTGAFLDVLMQDVRYGARSLRRTPGFALAAIATLALGIGANTTIFTLLDAVLFKPLPVPAARDLGGAVRERSRRRPRCDRRNGPLPPLFVPEVRTAPTGPRIARFAGSDDSQRQVRGSTAECRPGDRRPRPARLRQLLRYPLGRGGEGTDYRSA